MTWRKDDRALTPRELEILQFVSKGLRYKSIAPWLFAPLVPVSVAI
ncbi:hypothetical protein [Paenibacillus sp. GM2FR]|nr:hypothetical protein [Paenibacillus sp. GM2FR]